MPTRTRKSAIQLLTDDTDVIALPSREAHVAQLREALPEARVIKSVLDDHTSRVITFELLSEER